MSENPKPPGQTGLLASMARYLNRRLPRTYWVSTLIPRLLVGNLGIVIARHRGLGRPLDKLDFSAYKTSDTVFILATGASINDYPDERWNTIAGHDSIGMNFFILHEFVPTFYVMENMGDIHRALLKARASAYRGVPTILKNQLTNFSPSRLAGRMSRLEKNPPELRERFYYSLDLLAAGETEQDAYLAYKFLDRLGLFEVKPRFRLLTQRRGSVTYIVNLAARIGYRKIVLCGVDLNHTEYFYDSRREKLESQGFPVPPNRQHGEVHSTYDPNKHPVTVKDVILAMHRAALEPRGIELYVGCRSSALHPDLPEYGWP